MNSIMVITSIFASLIISSMVVMYLIKRSEDNYERKMTEQSLQKEIRRLEEKGELDNDNYQ